MLPYVIPLDVLSLYFSSVHAHLGEHKYKGLVCVGVYCVCRLLFKLNKAWQNKRKRDQRKEVSKVMYDAVQQGLDSLRHPVDITVADLYFQDLCKSLQEKSININDVLFALKIRAVITDMYTNSVIHLIDNEKGSSDMTSNHRSLRLEPAEFSLLQNVPISLAEVIHLQDLDSTAGMSADLDIQLSEDAVIVQLLRQQGAIPFMRTNVPQTAYITFGSSNPIYGVTKNPFKTDRSPGGSSSGEAVVIAMRGSMLGVGTDVSGGLRIPAHFCGICGLKPTSARISQKGVTVFAEGQNAVSTCVGPLSGEVAGLVAFMKTICVPLHHQLDPKVPVLVFDNEMYEGTKPIRVGFFIDDGHTKCVPSVRRTMLEAKRILENMHGYTVVPFTPPDLLWMLVNLYLPAMIGDHFMTTVRHLAIDKVDRCVTRTYYLVQIPFPFRWLFSWMFYRKIYLEFAILHGLLMKLYMPDLDHVFHKAWKQQFINQMAKQSIDVLLCPVLPFAAVKLGKEESLTGCLTYCVLFNLLDFPAGTIPMSVVTEEDVADLKLPEKYKVETSLEESIRQDQMGIENNPASSSRDLPIGVQVASLPYQDELVLRVLRDLEIRKKRKQ